MFVVVIAVFSLIVPLLLLFLPTVTLPALNSKPFVSVIVCAKNEEVHIVGCVQALLSQDYPKDRFELIFVDDGSTDDTLSLLEPYSKVTNIRVLKLQGNMGKKAGALNYGLGFIDFDHTKHVLFTDADCQVSAHWVSEMVKGLEQYNVVGGQTVVDSAPGLLAKLQQVEYVEAFSQMAVAQYFLRLSPALMGNNLGVNASYFHKGLRFVEGSWVEDAALVGELRSLGATVYFSTAARVVTFPEQGVGAVVAQRRRWFIGVKYVPLSLGILLGLQLVLIPLLYVSLWFCFVSVFVVLLFRFVIMFFALRKLIVNVTILEIVVYDFYQLFIRFRFLSSSLFNRSISWR